MNFGLALWNGTVVASWANNVPALLQQVGDAFSPCPCRQVNLNAKRDTASVHTTKLRGKPFSTMVCVENHSS